MILLIGILIVIVLSAFLYRIGGMSKKSAKKHFPWLPGWLVCSNTRDIGCTLIILAWVFCFLPHITWWVYLISTVLMKLALSTYWDESKYAWKNAICKKINWRYPKDNFYLHGLFIGLALFPISIALGVILGIKTLLLVILTTILVATSMGIWCDIFSNDFVEEYYRGGIIVINLIPLILL